MTKSRFLGYIAFAGRQRREKRKARIVAKAPPRSRPFPLPKPRIGAVPKKSLWLFFLLPFGRVAVVASYSMLRNQ